MAGFVVLAFGAGADRRIEFSALTGADEAAAADSDSLLARLARPGEGLVHGAALAGLTVGDRDRALAGLYETLYGSDVAADTVCGDCAGRYEIRFSLADLASSRSPDGSAEGEPPSVAVGRSRMRLPRRADVSGSPESLIERLTLSGPVPGPEAAAKALEAADPTLDFDLTGACPECGARQAVPFSIGAFLESALRRDRAFLAREVHLIAAAYHWALAEILSLTRADRQGFARLLIAEREAAAVPLRRVS